MRQFGARRRREPDARSAFPAPLRNRSLALKDRAGALARGWQGVGGIARSFVVVGGATLIGQGAVLLAAPVLARLYQPSDFGLLAVFAGVLSVLVAVASLSIRSAIPIAADRDEAVHLLLLSNTISVVAGLLVAVVVLLWGGQLAAALGVPELAPLLWLLPIALDLPPSRSRWRHGRSTTGRSPSSPGCAWCKASRRRAASCCSASFGLDRSA